MKTNYKILSLVLLLAVAIFPLFANAATAGEIITNIAKVFTSIVLVCVVIGWLITAFLFLMGSGNPNLIGMGKKAAFASIVGTAIYVLASIAFNITSNALLQGQ